MFCLLCSCTIDSTKNKISGSVSYACTCQYSLCDDCKTINYNKSSIYCKYCDKQILLKTFGEPKYFKHTQLPELKESFFYQFYNSEILWNDYLCLKEDVLQLRLLGKKKLLNKICKGFKKDLLILKRKEKLIMESEDLKFKKAMKNVAPIFYLNKFSQNMVDNNNLSFNIYKECHNKQSILSTVF